MAVTAPTPSTSSSGPSRLGTPSLGSTSRSGGAHDSSAPHTSKLNPTSQAFSFLQPDSIHTPPPSHPYSTYDPSYPPPPPPPFPIQQQYSPYPIHHQYHPQPQLGWAQQPPPPQGKASPVPPPPPAPWQHSPSHFHPQHPHHTQQYYHHHPQHPPPQATRVPPPPIPPPAPSPAPTNGQPGIFLPLQHNGPHHLAQAAAVAAAGYPPAGAATPTGYPGLLPPFSPSPVPQPAQPLPHRPSSAITPQPPQQPMTPAPAPASAMPVSPPAPLASQPQSLAASVSSTASPFAPSSVSLEPSSSSSSSLTTPAASTSAAAPAPVPSSPSAAASAPVPVPGSAPRPSGPPPRERPFRAQRTPLPPPREAPALSVAPWIAERVGHAQGLPVAVFRSRAGSKAETKTEGAKEKGKKVEKTEEEKAEEQPMAQAQAPKPDAPVSPPRAAPPPAAAAPTSPPPATPKSPAAAPVKRSWADLVRPAGGGSAPLVNGVTPISASTSSAPSDLFASPGPQTLSSLLSQPLPHAHHPAPPVPRGLINNGNLCFANAILQVLVWTGAFWNLMERVERGSRKDLGAKGREGERGEKSAVEAMIAFLAEFRNPSDSPAPAFDPSLAGSSASASSPLPSGSIPKPPFSNSSHPLPPPSSSLSAPPPLSPTPIHDALRHNPRFDAMRHGTQEDAEEFLGFFLETLHEEIMALVEKEKEREGKGKAKAVGGEGEGWEEVGAKGRVATTRTTEHAESPLTRIFAGRLRSVIRCPGQKDSVTIEPFQQLQLDIQPDHIRTVPDALLSLTSPEPLPDFSTPRGPTSLATKHVALDRLPPVLILHLKRFVYDERAGLGKSTKRVKYAQEMTVDPRVLSARARAEAGEDGARYELFGVVYHHGLHASGGHYTVAVRCGYRQKQWLKLDDTHIRVLGEPEEGVDGKERRWDGPAAEEDEHKHAYLLMYARVE
ncbi:hypothetical protein JCM10207_002141 [Rhodosporidiobolus poonsookiae]